MKIQTIKISNALENDSQYSEITINSKSDANNHVDIIPLGQFRSRSQWYHHYFQSGCPMASGHGELRHSYERNATLPQFRMP